MLFRSFRASDRSIGLIAVPNANYHFVSWSGDVSGTTTNGNSLSFYNMRADRNITASFAINTDTIKVTQGSNGTISPSTTVVNAGTSKTFTITAATGYSIQNVIVDNIGLGAQVTYTFSNITANHTIAATFKTGTSPNYTAIVSPNGSEVWKVGKSYPITWASNVANVKLSFISNGTKYVIAPTVTGSLGTYTWQVPLIPTMIPFN